MTTNLSASSPSVKSRAHNLTSSKQHKWTGYLQYGQNCASSASSLSISIRQCHSATSCRARHGSSFLFLFSLSFSFSHQWPSYKKWPEIFFSVFFSDSIRLSPKQWRRNWKEELERTLARALRLRLRHRGSSPEARASEFKLKCLGLKIRATRLGFKSSGSNICAKRLKLEDLGIISKAL